MLSFSFLYHDWAPKRPTYLLLRSLHVEHTSWDNHLHICIMMQVELMMEELSQAWRKLGDQPGGMFCIDMLVRPTCCSLMLRLSRGAPNCESCRRVRTI